MQTAIATNVEHFEPGAVLGTSTTSNDARELPDDCAMTDGVSAFVHVRKRLFGIAYRMLGSTAEAEDIVQEVWLRWQRVERTGVRDVGAFLATATTRLAINRVKSACMRQEAYMGTGLPDPIDTGDDPCAGAERGEALEVAVSMLLENLTASERAAYVLREAFNYDFSRIAEIIRLNEVNCRQLVTRARKHIAQGRRTSAGPAEQRRLMDAFISAAQHGDLTTLERLLAEDVVSYSDGGGLVRAARRPVVGRTRVAEFMAAPAQGSWRGVSSEPTESDVQSSMLISFGTKVGDFVMAHASKAGIDRSYWMMTPSKPASVARSLARRA